MITTITIMIAINFNLKREGNLIRIYCFNNLRTFEPIFLPYIVYIAKTRTGAFALDESVSLVQIGGIVLILAAALMVMASGEKTEKKGSYGRFRFWAK